MNGTSKQECDILWTVYAIVRDLTGEGEIEYWHEFYVFHVGFAYGVWRLVYPFEEGRPLMPQYMGFYCAFEQFYERYIVDDQSTNAAI